MLANAQRTAACLPVEVIRKLTGLRYGVGSELGIVLLRNMPLDADIPVQPKATSLWHKKTSFISEAAHLAVHAAIGTVPISYAPENGGDTVATLFPKPGDELKQESSGQVLLELHGENQAHRYPPEILTLSVLQEDGQTKVGTIIASSRLALRSLSAHEVEIGRRKIFFINPPASFKGISQASSRQSLISMFYGSTDDSMLRFDAHAMRSIEPEGEILIERMKRILMEVALTVYLRRGDLLVLDNRIVVHGRTSYKADLQYPRITQRAFGRFDFAGTRPLRQHGSTILQWAA